MVYGGDLSEVVMVASLESRLEHVYVSVHLDSSCCRSDHKFDPGRLCQDF